MRSSRIVSSNILQEFDGCANATTWRGAEIHQGLHQGLYKLVGEYGANHRTNALLLALELARSGFYPVMSIELGGEHRVWTAVRSRRSPMPIMRIDTLTAKSEG